MILFWIFGEIHLAFWATEHNRCSFNFLFVWLKSLTIAKKLPLLWLELLMFSRCPRKGRHCFPHDNTTSIIHFSTLVLCSTRCCKVLSVVYGTVLRGFCNLSLNSSNLDMLLSWTEELECSSTFSPVLYHLLKPGIFVKLFSLLFENKTHGKQNRASKYLLYAKKGYFMIQLWLNDLLNPCNNFRGNSKFLSGLKWLSRRLMHKLSSKVMPPPSLLEKISPMSVSFWPQYFSEIAWLSSIISDEDNSVNELIVVCFS